MRSGMFPGQEKALRERFAELEQKAAIAQRRTFFGVILGAVAGGVTTLALSKISTEAMAPADPETGRDWTHTIAVGPLDDLLQAQGSFVAELLQQRRPIEDTQWVGVTRLVHACVDRTAQVRPGLRPLLLQFETRQPPRVVAATLAMLERR